MKIELLKNTELGVKGQHIIVQGWQAKHLIEIGAAKEITEAKPKK